MPCGIAGFVGDSDTNLLRKMSDVIVHRGPDEYGEYVDGKVCLASRRLSIIDLKTGRQPIGNEDGTIQVVFNGEIYNFVELKRELLGFGHQFSTESDTETIVHAYEQWGIEFLKRLRGMFAIALWDSNKRQMLLARDRFGKKPLYYELVNGILLFGSEIKSILQYEMTPRLLNEEALPFFFQFYYIPSPMTIFAGIKSLPPAGYLIYREGQVEVSSYWDMAFNEDPKIDEETWIRRLYDTLFDAVKVRLRSDVPLGAFLSGGIDSSAIAALMQRVSRGRFHTFTIGFREEPYDETKFAQNVAEHIGSEHHESIVEPDALKILPKLVWHYDQPFADASMIPTYYLSEGARKTVKVSLSGDGGDEMFMGYRFLTDPPIYKYYAKVPKPIRQPMLSLVASLPSKKGFVQMAGAAKRLGYGDQPPEERYLLRVAFGGLDLGRCFVDEAQNKTARLKVQEFLKRKFDEAGNADYLNAASYVTMKTYLSEGILVKVDRASMATSLEVRCPFLDSEVASLVSRIPSQLRLQKGQTKYILKKMLSKYDLLPNEIIHREKHGFGVPMDFWFQGEWKHSAASILESSQGLKKYIDRQYIGKLLSQPDFHAGSIFGLMIFALWHRMFVENRTTDFYRTKPEPYITA